MILNTRNTRNLKYTALALLTLLLGLECAGPVRPRAAAARCRARPRRPPPRPPQWPAPCTPPRAPRPRQCTCRRPGRAPCAAGDPPSPARALPPCVGRTRPRRSCPP
eukprot:scaffold49384_cov60-Phaeocystis_antarctica.AAC.4